MTLARTTLAPLLFALICGSSASALAQQHYGSPARASSPSISSPAMAHPAPSHVQSPHLTQPIKTAPSTALVKPAEPASSKPEALTSRNGPAANGAIPASSVSQSITVGPSGMIGSPQPGSMVNQPMPRQPLIDVVPGTVRITIRAISAAGQGQALEIDGRLAPIGKDLRSFADQFSYRNYRLLDVQTFDLDFRSIAQMELPGQRAIAVEPRQMGEDGRVKVHLELLGQHPEHAPRMRADYSISRGATIFVGGYRIAPEGGTLLLAITQDE